ncbi:MAG: GTP-binding protein, partial [Flavobacterium sp.]|nr:GTP-binding protein [Flavobacterium sp.]
MEKHDLLHEFPQYQEKIHELKVSDAHFRKLFD